MHSRGLEPCIRYGTGGALVRPVGAFGRLTRWDAGALVRRRSTHRADLRTMRLVRQGRVVLALDGRAVAVIGEDRAVGDLCALAAEPLDRPAELTIRALVETELLVLDRVDFAAALVGGCAEARAVFDAVGGAMVDLMLSHERPLRRAAAASDLSPAALERLAESRDRLLAEWALRYHARGRPGKLLTTLAKPVDGPADLAVMYTPGVAAPCRAIVADPDASYRYTGRGRRVAVITNGTAVLGLGDIGPLAAQPVMEGKAALFKALGGLDAVDIGVDETDPAHLADIVCRIAVGFGGINLEDIRAPECFEVEARCRARLDIPVLHDDQHGTAIAAGAALLNALRLTGRRIDEARVVFAGAGAGGFATAQFFIALGVRPERVVLTDIDGVVHRDRPMADYLRPLAVETDARTLADVIGGADVFVGLSTGRVLTPPMLRAMAPAPIVLALANPDPEIDPGLALRTRPDVLIGTGRSDAPNQVNNLLAFPYVFRGALDCRATTIDEGMKIAAAHAIAGLARAPGPRGEACFGRDAFVPRPADPRLLPVVASAVAEAARAAGVARVPLDPARYRKALTLEARAAAR